MYQEKGEVQAFANIEHVTAVSVSTAFPAVQGQMHPLYPVNMCMPTQMPPQYQSIVSYQVPTMVSGPHLIGSTPGYYLAPHGHPQQPPYVQQHHMPVSMNHQPYFNNQKRKNNSVRAKYSPRKEIPNGHEGYSNYMYQQDGYMRGQTCFSGDMVQAATGVPIVMHPQQPVASFIQSHAVHVSAAHTAPIYSPVTFTQQLPIPPPVEEIVVASPIVEPEAPVVAEVVAPVEPASVVVSKVELPINVTEETVSTEKSSPSPKPVVPVKDEAVALEASEPKSWASLFKKDVAVAAVLPDKPTARVEPFTTSTEDAAVKVNAAAVAQRPQVDRRTKQLAEHLANYELLTTPLPLLPRGLINKSNWCYINATLQALIACPSFVHLVKSLAPYCGGKTEDFSTPIIDSV